MGTDGRGKQAGKMNRKDGRKGRAGKTDGETRVVAGRRAEMAGNGGDLSISDDCWPFADKL